MKQVKKTPRLQLEKFSTIFTQLGLVLVLFVVFISLEHESEQSAVIVDIRDTENKKVFLFDETPIFEKEVIKKKQVKVEKIVVTEIFKPEVVKNDVVVEKIILKPTDNIKEIDIDEVEVVETVDVIDVNDDPTPIDYVAKIPVFEGCEKSSKKSEKEGRKCFDRKMSKLVNRYFDSGLGKELGLKSGKHRILTQFVIDKTGKVTDVKIRAPHATLKKEVNRVVSKIPNFTPGENNRKEKVKVRYSLPITFQVE